MCAARLTSFYFEPLQRRWHRLGGTYPRTLSQAVSLLHSTNGGAYAIEARYVLDDHFILLSETKEPAERRRSGKLYQLRAQSKPSYGVKAEVLRNAALVQVLPFEGGARAVAVEAADNEHWLFNTLRHYWSNQACDFGVAGGLQCCYEVPPRPDPLLFTMGPSACFRLKLAEIYSNNKEKLE
jgi:hypothetical protein